MPYRIKTRESVRDAVRRVAREQADAAVEATSGADVDAAVHDVRTRCKKLRGLIRLVRPCFADDALENADYRDTARLLAGARDAAVRLAAFDRLLATGDLDADACAAVRRLLQPQRDEPAEAALDPRRALMEAKQRLLAARRRIDDWRLSETGFEAVRRGLKRTYARGRGSMRAAFEPGPSAARAPTAEQLHTWRKQAKDHWYHCRLLRDVWREQMGVRRAAARKLTDLLGDDHDLALLAAHLRRFAADGGELLDAIDRRRAQLQREAYALGRRLYAEKPGAFADRIEAYWRTWRPRGG